MLEMVGTRHARPRVGIASGQQSLNASGQRKANATRHARLPVSQAKHHLLFRSACGACTSGSLAHHYRCSVIPETQY